MKILKSLHLSEGITHIEDLPVDEFIQTVRTLKNKIITEKLDGAALWFGLDEQGVFTSREGKSSSSTRARSADDYAATANFNAFRAAHEAIAAVAPTIKKYLQDQDIVEIEVIFGRQPNTVLYGTDKNYIVFLRPIGDTDPDRVRRLSAALNNHSVQVSSTVISSDDGEQLKSQDLTQTWVFTSVRPMRKKISTAAADDLLRQLEKFLAEKNSQFPAQTNQQVAELNLTSVDREQRAAARAERQRVLDQIQNDFKLPIKDLLLNNIVRKSKSILSSGSHDHDVGIEGVVIRDAHTGAQTKLVDRDVFTAINTFNNSVRSTIAGLVRTTDQDSAVAMRGGALGQAKIRIAELMGLRDLALSSGLRRTVSKFKQDSAELTADAIARSLNIDSLPGARTKIIAILKNAREEIDQIVDDFKQQQQEYRLHLKTGKQIGISPDVAARTLTAAAETKRDINEIISAVAGSKTVADLIMALYGKTIHSIFNGETTSMSEHLKSINNLLAEQEGGEGGEGGVTSAAAVGGFAPALFSTVPATGTTSASAIAAFPKPLFQGSKIISKRRRTFVKPKKFAAPGEFTQKNENKFSLLKSLNEDYTDVKSMRFASDVDDSAKANNDATFRQLRNSVAIGDHITQSSVSKYLDKAHEINNTVDTITFGMETDAGDIVKVYVAATQANDFEKALSSLLGEKDDIEEVINLLSAKFDIVDVEWPKSMHHNAEHQDEVNTTRDEMAADAESGADEPEIDFTTSSSEEFAGSGTGGDRYKNLRAITDAVEAAGAALEEDAAGVLHAISDMLAIMGIDAESSRSIESQANQARARAAFGKIDSTTLSKIQGLAALINKKVHPGQPSPAAAANIPSAPAPAAAASESRQRPRLLTSFIAEQPAPELQDLGAWSISKLGGHGLTMQVRGHSLELDHAQAQALATALAHRATSTVQTTSHIAYEFKPLQTGGWSVRATADDTAPAIMLKQEQVDQIIADEAAQ